MKKSWLLILGLLLANPVTAGWNQAIIAYEQQDYSKAKQHFSELVAVGNAQAMFSLAAMNFNGEGQAADKVSAVALFQLAATYGHQDAAALAADLALKLTETEQAERQQVQQQWQSNIAIPAQAAVLRQGKAVSPLSRKEPAYPVDAARRGQAGFVRLHFVVDDSGKVNDVTVLEAYPEQVFVRSAIKAVEKWQYPAGQAHLTTVILSFTLEVPGEARIDIKQLEQLLFENKLWDLALAGSAEHQLLLSHVWRHLAEQGVNHFVIDTTLPLTKPDLALLVANQQQVRATFSYSDGTVLVEVDAEGVITAQRDQLSEQASELVGNKLQGIKAPGLFLLQSRTVNNKPDILVKPAHKVSPAWSADYWLEQAARHGQREAQRVLAAEDQHWQAYLLAQQDPVVLAWQTTGLLAEQSELETLAE